MKRTQHTVSVIGLLTTMVTGAGCNDEANTGIPDLADKPTFAVQLSDYQSAGIALIDGDGKLLEEKYISSGSALSGLSTALHSDIALPTTPCDADVLTVVARLGGDYVLQVDLDSSEVTHQIKTQGTSGDGAYQANPQDILCLGDGRALVSRNKPNLTAKEGDIDLGDDLVLIDLDEEKLVERIDLSDFRGEATAVDDDGNTSTQLTYARPGNIARVGDHALVGLSRYSESFAYETHGLLALLDLGDFSVQKVELEGLANCGSLVTVAGRDDAVIVQCAGAPYGDRANTGLALVSVSGDKAEVEHVFKSKASDPLIYASTTSLGGTRVIAASQDYVAQAPDTAYVVDLADGSISELFTTTNPGDIGSGVFRSDTGLLLVPDVGVGVRVFRAEGDKLTAQDPIELDPALPARSVRALVSL